MASLTDNFNRVSTVYYIPAIHSYPQSVGRKQSSDLWGDHTLFFVGMIASHYTQQLPWHSSSEPPLAIFTLAGLTILFCLIHVLGATPIEVPLEHWVISFRSIKKLLSALELLEILEVLRYIRKTELKLSKRC